MSIQTIIILAFLAMCIVYGLLSIISKTERDRIETSIETIESILTIIDDIILTCVKETQQTFVSELKQTGNFTDDKAREAYEKCIDSVNDLLSEEMKDVIIGLHGNIRLFLKEKIESAVYSIKQSFK